MVEDARKPEAPRSTTLPSRIESRVEKDPPRSIGRYAVRDVLGQGGMGVVHLGWDSRLDRPVAIKKLSAHLADDRHRIVWLQREAKALAALNHPNIATVHSLEEDDDGSLFLTQEYVEGETLRELLDRGPLPFTRALLVGDGIASALEAAHERGIVHRDLKPGNIMVTPRGDIKVLDFGLALRTKARVSGAAGTKRISGTPGYMSPEQARGEPEDGATDVFAFGCVLYECLTGLRAFPGDSQEERLEKLFEHEPDLSALPGTPRELRELVARCLEPERERRLADVSDATVAIRQILGEDVTPFSRRRAALAGTPNNLPNELSSFVGRGRELEECRKALEATRLLTLSGLGGSGKSRLARAVARQSPAAFPHGIWWVELAPLSDPDRLVPAVTAACRVQEKPNLSSAESLFRELSDRRVLVLLDNCEHLLPACAGFVTELLKRCPGARVLATSRERLAVPGEKIHAVPPLPVPEETGAPHPDELRTIESVQLFVERAGLVQPGFVWDASTAPVVARICRRLEGIPLAIELAASRTQMLSLEEIDEKLADRFRLLRGGVTDGLPHHRTLRATLDWSDELLDDESRQLFRRLSVFRGGWTLEAAAAVCAPEIDVLDLLDSLAVLADKSLVVWTKGVQGHSRYHMLETVREYARDRLRESGDPEALSRRHAEWFLEWGRGAVKALGGPEAGGWRLRLEADHENLLAAAERCDRGDATADLALEIAGATWWFWYTSGHFAVGRSCLERALARSGAPSKERANALNGAACLAWAQGDSPAARSFIEELLGVMRTVGGPKDVAQALSNLGSILYNDGAYSEARANYEEALRLFESEGEEPGTAAALSNLSLVAYALEDPESARSLMERSLEIRRRRDDRLGMVISLTQLGQIATNRGEQRVAARHLVECFELLRETGDRSQAPFALEALAILVAGRARDDAELRQAAGLLGTAEALRESTGAGLSEIGRQEHDTLVATLRRALGAAYDDAVGRGAARSLEDTIERVLEVERDRADGTRR